VTFRLPFWNRGLGKLEREVMEIVWRSTTAISVRDVHERLSREMAYTTVMTTLDRLYKKGLLARATDGKAYRYSAKLRRHELAMALVSNLVDDIGETDRELLDELERFVREKKRDVHS
jgi:predicted transcriptional regulator